MNNFSGYKCSLCNSEFLPISIIYTCPNCGGNLDVVWDYDKTRKKYHPEDITSRTENSLWRYAPLLPVPFVWDRAEGSVVNKVGYHWCVIRIEGDLMMVKVIQHRTHRILDSFEIDLGQ